MSSLVEKMADCFCKVIQIHLFSAIFTFHPLHHDSPLPRSRENEFTRIAMGDLRFAICECALLRLTFV
jgi:hypothetical protein